MRKAFTLIELLVVIAIIAVLAVVVVLTLNPGQLILQSRDSNRLSDLASLNSALSLYQTDASINGSVSLGSSSILYVSLPDPAATSTLGSNCASLGLPSAPAGYTYHCAASSTFRKVDGSGWIPVNLSSISSGAPLGQLPIDPVNTSSTGNYLTYVASSTQYMVTALPESQKQKLALAIQPMVSLYPSVMAVGNTQAINPLFSTQGLVGYWPMDEGTSTVALDMSGSGNNGTWSGSLINGSHYAGGKVGNWAGNSDGSTTYVGTTATNFPTGSAPRSVFAWMYWDGSVCTAASVCPVFYYGTETSLQLSGIGITQSKLFFNNWAQDWNPAITITPNVWYLVGYVWNSPTLTLYYNGQSQSISSLTVNTVIPGSDPADIGKRSNSDTAFHFPGRLDDVRIYNRALSAAEVQALYNSQR